MSSNFSDETIKVSVTFGSTITFLLRMIGLVEEQQIRQRSLGVTTEDQAEKEYHLNVSILRDLSTGLPEGIDDNGNETPAAVIDRFFAEKTVTKERIAFYAVRGYFMRLQPSESFL